MTDIVERLRSRSPYLHGSSAECTMAEAADEIERLKALLRRHQVAAWCEEDSDLAVETRAALEPSSLRERRGRPCQMFGVKQQVPRWDYD